MEGQQLSAHDAGLFGRAPVQMPVSASTRCSRPGNGATAWCRSTWWWCRAWS